MAIADHWEPYWQRASDEVAGERVAVWVKRWPEIARRHGDSNGRPPQYTFFYPQEEYQPRFLDALAEMRRLGVACGARPGTFSGLSGLGDLAVTCYSRLSRNRAFGERVGRGEKVEAVLAGARTVAEGYPTARAAHQLARKLGIETPIIDEVHAMLYEAKEIRRAVQDLMARGLKPED